MHTEDTIGLEGSSDCSDVKTGWELGCLDDYGRLAGRIGGERLGDYDRSDARNGWELGCLNVSIRDTRDFGSGSACRDYSDW